MFEGRLKFLLIVFALPVVAIILRLVQLQVIRADMYQGQAQKMLELPPRLYPFIRGQITDHEGRPLAYDAPVWDIAVYYGILAYNDLADDKGARQQLLRRAGIADDEDLGERIDASLTAICELTGTPMDDLLDRCQNLVAKVGRIKESVERRLKVKTQVLEELMPHAVVKGLDQREQVEACLKLADYPWVKVVPGHTRKYEGGPAFGHLLGRLAQVDAETIQNDPVADDPLRRYQPGEMRGISGVEAMGEAWLRGTRGRVHENRRGQAIEDPVEPVHGKTMRLTIDRDLQETLYRRLEAVIESNYPTCGASAVLLDIPSRQVLAMVDYPSIDPALSPDEQPKHPDDEFRQPDLFRAVAGRYPPGSTVKPMILAAAMKTGLVSASTRIECTGSLFRDQPDRWRCLGRSESVDPVLSIQTSCNVFYYTLGQRLGTQSLALWMSRYGLGRHSGIGLPQDKAGQLTNDTSNGAARLAAIGQGEMSVTPIQSANMVATIASGVYQPVTVWADDPDRGPVEKLDIPDSAWRTVREGMYRVVNKERGTAFDRAVLTDPGDYVLLGKTGSADAPPRRWLYNCRFPDGSVRSIAARDARALLDRYSPDEKPEIIGRKKIEEEHATHAWFIGYLTSKKRYLEPVTDDDLSVAIAVVIEYSGHGGEVAAPVAADMIQSAILRHWQRSETSAISSVGGHTP